MLQNCVVNATLLYTPPNTSIKSTTSTYLYNVTAQKSGYFETMEQSCHIICCSLTNWQNAALALCHVYCTIICTYTSHLWVVSGCCTSLFHICKRNQKLKSLSYNFFYFSLLLFSYTMFCLFSFFVPTEIMNKSERHVCGSVSHDIRLQNQHIPTNCSQITRSWMGDFLSQAVLWNRWRNSVMLQRILKGLCVRKRMIPQAATWQEVRKQASKGSFEKRVLTLAGGESGAPGVAPYAHHQRISHQVVAVVTLELQSMPSVQAEFLHFTVQHLFGADAASDHWQDRKTTGMWCQTCLMHRRPFTSFAHCLPSIPSHVGTGRLHVPLSRQVSVSGPTSCSPGSHT